MELSIASIVVWPNDQPFLQIPVARLIVTILTLGLEQFLQTDKLFYKVVKKATKVARINPTHKVGSRYKIYFMCCLCRRQYHFCEL